MNKLISSVVLLEGITHIEDLPLSEFIRTVESLKEKIVTEKLDGSNLWFGVDENGLYTSREGKSKKSNRFYNVSDYPMVANYNGFRAAHLALEGVESTILKHFENGDQAEIEVLYGRQPNTVAYGVQDKSFIVILRPVGTTTQETVDALAKDLNKKQVKVRSKVVYSEDGDKLVSADTDMVWEFTNVEPIDSKKIDTSDAMALLGQMKKFMAQKNKVLKSLTNEEVAELSLNTIPKEEREAAKAERDRINDFFLKQFKEPIKEHLLGKLVRKIKPFLQADELDPSEDIGVEGVVVRDPVSGSMTKIVDKDVFTAVNTFNSAIRNHITGLVRTDKQDAPIELRGGAYGQAKIRIADLLGARELALSSGAKRFLTKFKGDDPSTTAIAVAKSLNIDDLEGTKTKISAVLKNTSQEIQKILEKFKSEAGDFKLKLKTGKEIGISPEVMRRTLTAFAETKQDIAEVASRVQRAKTPADLVMALYGKTIESIFAGEESTVKESYSLLKAIVHEDDGAAAATSTVAGDIAQPQPNLFQGSKTIVRRQRKFVKVKKFPAPEQQKADAARGIPEAKTAFSLMKSVSENWAHLSDMKYATDVDDSAAAQNDIEFKQMRNDVNIGADVTASDVDQYLDKAHELNDEVDTVTFGMEMDDGQVVKVYVAATDADGFEKALSELLGSEDDVEKVVNNLADEYDIVDVEWPEGYKVDTVGNDSVQPVGDDTEAGEAGDIDLNGDGVIDFSVDGDGEDNFDLEVPSDEGEGDGEISTDSSEVDSGEDSTEEVPADSEGEGEGDTGSEDSAEAEGASDGEDESVASEPEAEEDGETTDDTGSEEVSDELSADGEQTDDTTDDTEQETDDEGEDEEAGFLDTVAGQSGEKKKKKKKEASEESDVTEESTMTKSLGELFKEKLLAEARGKNAAEEDDKEDPAIVAARAKQESALEDLLEAFPSKQARAVITLMVSLGVPTKPLMSRRAALRQNIAEAAELYLKSASFRMWVKKFLTALQDATVKEDAASFDKKLTNKFQHVIYAIMLKLGLPAEVVTVSQRQLVTGIRGVAKAAMTNSDVRIYLMSIAKELGVEDAGQGMPEEEEVKESVVLEGLQDAEALVLEILTTLGFDTTANRSIQSQMKMQAARGALTKLAASSSLVAKMAALNQLLDKQIQ